MNALTVPTPSTQSLQLRAMRWADLHQIMDIELRAYPFPWTLGVFRDCLRAGYIAQIVEYEHIPVGYGVISVAAEEAHLLNLSIDPDYQAQGYGRYLLRALLDMAYQRGARRVFLEVRPSNAPALALYHSEGFNEIGLRRRYYPARPEREDALVMAVELLD